MGAIIPGFLGLLIFVAALLAMLLRIYALFWARSAFKYNEVPLSSGVTAAKAAEVILRRNGLLNVQVVQVTPAGRNRPLGFMDAVDAPLRPGAYPGLFISANGYFSGGYDPLARA